MDSRLSSGLRLWLSLPGWLLLLSQGVGIGTLALLGGGWLLQDEWRQRENAAGGNSACCNRSLWCRASWKRRRKPLSRRRRLRRPPPAIWRACCNGRGRFAALAAAGKPPRQTLSLRIDYTGLLVLLEALPADLRLEQLSVETPPLGMTARLVLQDATEDQPDE